jgi:precorrin-6Y C5,15-methyltransferase (decarboxylating)
MKTIHVLGLGLGPQDLTTAGQRLIQRSEALAGGARLLGLFPEHPGPKLVLTKKVDQWLEEVAQTAQERRVTVLASGDPGFYGVAARLVDRFGPERVVIHPNVSTVQAAFARLKQPWQDAAFVSLHGRSEDNLWRALASSPRVAVFTDAHNTPGRIARLLLERGQEHWSICVLEDLGSARERIGEYTLDQAAGQDFSPLNLVVLKRLAQPKVLLLGAPEAAYQHQAGLITKPEARAVALAKLALKPGQTLWDLGAGSGSLGLEASLLVQGGRIVAVEREPDRVRDIKANRKAYGVANLEVVRADLPRGLEALPDPDRVFVGGGGRDLEAIIEAAARRLPQGGVLVVSLVRLEALEGVMGAMKEMGLQAEATLLQVSRGRPLGDGNYLKALNPVWLIRGRKAGERRRA